ncbi:hypothetical protein DI09_34p190 [Mitosporidium daphniae]|uniref:Nucleoside transporter n=1 Tax=Mitosporidium daphniae TaxID=1485682 RepID=A0A098VR05_9MICR|nr:uncharacterized protein DI09_34p190 [Mitosporidium daphniae]KGG51468.1 hypothetical protein DI09_34p190 [Mitosporidium daphniae]|eukprot:XP_013237895.1 uncharacterized protein DI09_34p190 [Mitosporidium daphniae]
MCCLVFVVFSLISVSQNLPEAIFIVSSMALVFLASVSSVFLYTGNYAILSTLPKPFSQAISLGQGTAGMITCIAKLITIKIFQENLHAPPTGLVHRAPTDSDSFLYFFFTALLLFFSSLSFFFYMKYSSSIFKPKAYHIIDEKDVKYFRQGASYSPPDPFDHAALGPSKSRGKCSLFELCSIVSSKNSSVRCLWWCNFIVCFQTMFLFPSWPQMTKSTDPSYSEPVNGQFFTIFVLLLFNVGDWFGRIILSFPAMFIHVDRLLFLVSLLRFLHVPLYLFGNVDFGGHHLNPLPKLLASDYIVMANTLLFGVSSGYLTTLFLIEAPNRVSNNLFKIRVSFYMLLGLVLSVALGSIASLVLKIVLLSYGGSHK